MADEAKDVMDDALEGEIDVDADMDTDADDAGDDSPVVDADDHGETDVDKPVDDAKPKADDQAPADPVTRIEALEREKSGIYREMMSERQQRQEMKARMDAITEALMEIKARRDVGLDDPGDQAPAKTVKGIPVKFDDDGNPYLDPSDLKGMTASETKDIKADLNQMRQQTQMQVIARQNAEIVQSVLGQDDRFPEAAQVMDSAYRYLDAAAGAVMGKHGLSVENTNMDHVLTLMEQEYGGDFASKFPGIDMDMVVEAMAVKPGGVYNGRKINRALRSIADALKPRQQGKSKLENLKFMASKPNSLVGQRNQKGAAGRTLKDISDIGVDEFMNMSDADIRKIERALGSIDA